jgi:hypothetical protein
MHSLRSGPIADYMGRQLRYASLPFHINFYRLPREMDHFIFNVLPMSPDDFVTYLPDCSNYSLGLPSSFQ